MTASSALLASIEQYRNAIAQDPSRADLQINLGAYLDQSGDKQGAVRSYQRALILDPHSHQAYNNLGTLFARLNDHKTAHTFLEAAATLNPNSADTHNNLGNLYLKQDLIPAAIDSYTRAIALNPNQAAFHNHLGKALIEAERYPEAEAALHRAIALRPDYADAYINLGFLALEQLDIDRAGQQYRKAIEIVPDHAMAHTLLSQTLLLRGHYAEGWLEQEWRWRWSDFPSPKRSFPQPQWRGEPSESVAGTHIFLHAEQGFGDTLQMLRYIPLVAARGATITLEVHPELKRLAETLDCPLQVIARGDLIPPFNQHCPLMSLPLAFATTLETVPASPYLRATLNPPAERRPPSPESLRVGLVWAGNPANRRDRKRSLPLPTLAPLFAMQSISFYSLQRGPAASETEASLLPFAASLAQEGDFADTAAAITSLDLILTVDTAVAHLAGALGKPVWLLLPRVPSWRWLLNRNDSPWYPTARIFRQQTAGDWEPVIAQVAAALSSIPRRI
jgi:Tfp pilus assembly protein PilF